MNNDSRRNYRTVQQQILWEIISGSEEMILTGFETVLRKSTRHCFPAYHHTFFHHLAPNFLQSKIIKANTMRTMPLPHDISRKIQSFFVNSKKGTFVWGRIVTHTQNIIGGGFLVFFLPDYCVTKRGDTSALVIIQRQSQTQHHKYK